MILPMYLREEDELQVREKKIFISFMPILLTLGLSELSVLIKFESDDVYRAIYLEHLTVKELTEKIIERSDIKKPVSKVIRKFKRSDKKSIVVRMEDDVVKDMQEEQDILVQTEDNEDGQSVTLVLVF